MKKIILFILLNYSCLAKAQQTELIIPAGHQYGLGISGLKTSPDGSLAVSFVNQQVKIWDIKRAMLLKTLYMPVGFTCEAAAFSPDSKTLILSKEQFSLKDNEPNVYLQIIDTKTFLVKKEWPAPKLFMAKAIVFSANGESLFIGCSKGVIARLTLATGDVTTFYEPEKKDGYTKELFL